MAINLTYRSYEQEWMDDLDSGGEVMTQTLRELDIINRLLGGNPISLQGLKTLLNNASKQEYTLADLGCGGGDILILMAKWARKNNIPIQFIGIDANPNIIAYAKERCKNYPEITFQCINIFDESFTKQPFDIVHASLFTHHFTEQQLVALFLSIHQQAKIGFIINDLHRHWLAYYAIKILTRLFSKSAMVRHDAAVSVARAFKKSEWLAVFEQSGLTNVNIVWKWAFRWKIVGKC
ncbi:MAG: methyltransferase domain-containing protein [Saprospiraceae bacterium]|nr:methyltransferase domain-containing protein [Saprospiraceae bacterium]